jgi:hypothetical protein
MDTLRLHASCAVLNDRAVLLRGPSGAGKSDLLLRLLVEAGAGLVADDQVLLTCEDAGVIARAPETLGGVVEVRGVGLVRLPPAGSAPVGLLADLTPRPQRQPDPSVETLLGRSLPRVEINPTAASAVAKLQLALGGLGASILPADWHPTAPAGSSGGDDEDTG